MFGIFVAFTMSWFYSGTNVINRKLKNIHFSVIGFYHPLIGMILGVIWQLCELYLEERVGKINKEVLKNQWKSEL